MTMLSTTVGFRHKSVLVVEDDAKTQMILKDIFTGAGFDTASASNREEAILLCDRRAFDMAFVDKILVDDDANNRDGLAVLRYISRKNEGTYLILLTGKGKFEDTVELSDEDIVFKPMSKNDPKIMEQIRETLNKAVARPQPEFKKGSSAIIFCGREAPEVWESKAHAFLKPAVKLLGLINFLDEIAQTCTPILERPEDNGIQRTSADGVMAGLYWSRGVGEAILIVLAKDKIPDEIPRPETWPATLRQDKILYHAKHKNLAGAIIKCTGAEHIDFTVSRSPIK